MHHDVEKEIHRRHRRRTVLGKSVDKIGDRVANPEKGTAIEVLGQQLP
ncbi:hypothetical protein [Natronorubrum tibetense]|nr:hypothetical protein [Natronorubrum tibetense]